MPQIRPISDLRNKFTEISWIVHEDKEPVFLTKNGYGDMVVMSFDDYKARKFTHDVDIKLLGAGPPLPLLLLVSETLLQKLR